MTSSLLADVRVLSVGHTLPAMYCIPVLDCAFPLTPEYSVRGEGHPNAAAHDRWSACIERGLRPLLLHGSASGEGG